MRNAFVVLVSLYIGLASGFIVPPGATETLNKTRTVSVIKLNNDNKNNTLEKIANGVIKESLYEDANEKPNNLKERSFILLNQKYKTSLEKQEYGFQVHGWSPRINEDRSFMINGKAQLNEPSYRFSVANIDNSKRVIISNNKVKDPGLSNPVPFVINQQNSKINSDYNRPKYEFNENLEEGKNSDKQRNYLELLKPPQIRPIGDQNRYQNNYDSNNDLHRLNYERYDNEPFTFSNSEVPTDLKHHQHPSQFGFSEYHPIHNEPYDNVPKNTDKIIHKQLDNNWDERRVFEKFNKGVQDKLRNDNVNKKYDDCNYRECITKTIGQEVYNTKYTGKLPECTCANRLSLTIKDRSAIKDRSQREKYDNKSPVPVPPEGNDYEELFNEEDDVTSVVNKISDTLRS